jgi:imidazolonepropionase-like amidohydrolase
VRATNDQADSATFAPQLLAASAVHPHSEHVRVARTAGITTALTVPSGGIISGQSAVIHLDGWTTPEMLVKDAWGLQLAVPSLPLHLPEDDKERKKRTDEQKESMRKLDTFMKRARHYAKLKAAAEVDPGVRLEPDLRFEAMIPYLRGERPVAFRVRTYKQMLDAIAFADKHDLRCVLSGAQEAWKLADVLAEKNIPVILGSPLAYPSTEYEPWDSVYRCASVLDRAGVRFCFGSNNAAGAVDLPIAVGMAVAHGLPRKRAEHALTLGAAQILGVDDRVGSIEAGKQADLIITTDTPLQAVSQVTHMFIAGRPIELSSLHTETYEKFDGRPTPELAPAPVLVGPPSLSTK